MGLSRDALRRLAGEPVVVDGNTLDVQTQVMLDSMRRLGIVQSDDVEQSRREMEEDKHAVAPVPPVMESERDVLIGPMRARIYRPKTASAKPGMLVFFHGGGWVFGDLETHDNLCRSLANVAGCSVVSVDYRLAPEAKFPVSVDDAFAATQWAADNAQTLGLDPVRLAVAGDSAGGNLATVVSLMAARSGAIKIVYQVLLYPATDLALTHDSYRRGGQQFNLTTAAMRWFRELYLTAPDEVDDWRASPLRAKEFANMPPAFIATAGCDPLCDEGEAYARLLECNNVPVTLRHFPGQMHGFASMVGFVRAAEEVLADVGAALKQAWARAS